jgi:hypothetical protein
MKFGDDIFVNRAQSHAAISILYPQVRRNELTQLLQRLDLSKGHRVCDFQAAGGFLSYGILESQQNVNLTMVEPSASLAEHIEVPGAVICSPLLAVPRPTGFFDRLGCLAGLHHEERPLLPIFEIYRLLNHGGLAVVAEVEANSTPARWLNEFVDKHTTNGHEGRFVSFGEMSSTFKAAGFQSVVEEKLDVPWYFSDTRQMLLFVRAIFGLYSVPDAVLTEALSHYFKLTLGSGPIEMAWSLIYCSGRKVV